MLCSGFLKIRLFVFKSLWDALLKIKLDESALGRLKFYLAHADIRYFTLKYLKSDFYAKNKVYFVEHNSGIFYRIKDDLF